MSILRFKLHEFSKVALFQDLTWLFKIGETLLSCILAIIVGAILIKISRVIIHRVIKVSPQLSERKSKTLTTVTQSVCKYIIYFFVFCHILTKLGIDVTSLIAVAGVGSVAIAFGAQSLVQDLLTGVFILMEDQFGIGDVINIDGLSGTVENISIRTTRIRSVDGNLHIVPNGQIKALTNMSKGFNRAVIDIGVAYEADTDKVIAIMQDELNRIYKEKLIKGILKEPQVLGVVNLSESSVDIRISADAEVGENWNIERELRRLMKKRLDKENISIPYPQRVVHIVKDN